MMDRNVSLVGILGGSRTAQRVLQALLDLSPRGIRMHLGLSRPIYKRTSAYGHFGRTPNVDGSFYQEKTDLVDELRPGFLIPPMQSIIIPSKSRLDHMAALPHVAALMRGFR